MRLAHRPDIEIRDVTPADRDGVVDGPPHQLVEVVVHELVCGVSH